MKALRSPPFFSLPWPVKTVGSPVPHSVTSADSGSTWNAAAAIELSVTASVGAVGGVFWPLKTPPLNRLPQSYGGLPAVLSAMLPSSSTNDDGIA